MRHITILGLAFVAVAALSACKGPKTADLAEPSVGRITPSDLEQPTPLAANLAVPAQGINANAMASAGRPTAAQLGGEQYSGPGSQAELQRVASDRVLFETDSTTVNAEGHQLLGQVARWLQSNPTVTLLIEGHADERGTRAYNFALGEKRATAVRNSLARYGIPSARVQTVSYGKERPEVAISQPGAWSQNRRAVLKVM